MKFAPLLAAIVLAATAPAYAQSHADHAAHASPSASADTAPRIDGEIRKIDLEQGKVTLKHGPIDNLGMPAMTMVFKAASPRLLDNLKPGDKVKFSADSINGTTVVTAIEAVK